MKDVRPIISKNLAMLRKEKGITQAELASKLNYSDKAVSRWEHGDTLPDVNVLLELCEFYGITLDDLVNEDCEIDEETEKKKEITSYKIWRCILSTSIVWLIATIVFLYNFVILENTGAWVFFIWAVPISALVFCIFGKGILNLVVYCILTSVMVWTVLAALYLSFLVASGFAANMWQLFIVGIPLQLVVILTYKMKSISKRT